MSTKHLLRNLNIYYLRVGNKRLMSTNYGLVYEQFGEPIKVIKKVDITENKGLDDKHILIEYLASPINPADINTIQGVYAIKPQLPAIGGNEGVAHVVKVGPEVTKVKVGQRVIPGSSASGTWRTYAVTHESDVIPIDDTIDVLSAAQLSVNPCTAYRMCKDFIALKKGDTIIQNGANSAVGLNVIQLAKHWGFNTLNIVRNRPNLDELKSRLTSLGANYVVTEEELRQSEVMDKLFKSIPKPKLALNCVGGKNATDCMRHLSFRGVMVTYGGMSKQPLTLPTGSLIFKDHKFCGYWMSRWNQENAISEERFQMLTYLCDLIKRGELVTPKTIKVTFDDYKEALEKSMQGFNDAKYVFVMK